MSLVFVDDTRAGRFLPFALTRPVCELRTGAELVRRRWETALGLPTTGFVGAEHLADFDEDGAAQAVQGEVPAGSLLVNARCAIHLKKARQDASVWICDGRLAAVRTRLAMPPRSGAELWRAAEQNVTTAVVARVDGWWMDHVWDLVRHLPAMLAADIPILAALTRGTDAAFTKVGTHDVHVEEGATIEPFVVIDATAGPVLVRRGSTIHSFTRLVGPCVIGEQATVHGGKVAASAIGEHSRVCGEVSTTIITGHANKAHDGFIGHSVLGRWVNLGASTVTSNLKNTYGDVTMWEEPDGPATTGMQFLGTMFGDHAKTAIGTRLTTGGVVGAGANVLASGLTPKHIPPFTWGEDGATRWDLARFLATADRVMQRRHVALSDKARRQLTRAWQIGTDQAG